MSSARSDSASGHAPAPGDLELVEEFLNSVDAEEGWDKLSSVEDLRAWLSEHDLVPASSRVTEADLRLARGTREAIRALAAGNVGEPIPGEALEQLNAAVEKARLEPRFGSNGQSRLEAMSHGTTKAIGRLLAIVFQSMLEGTWSRFKVCASDTCRWGFYDYSKNQSGTWCSMSSCGNKVKTRAYRERVKQRAS